MTGNQTPFDRNQPVIFRVGLDVYNWLVPLTAINILWLLFSLTLVLLPPATAALYDVAYRAAQGEGPRTGLYLAAVRRWLARAWLWGLLVVVYLLATSTALVFYSRMEGDLGALLHILAVLIAALAALAQFYFWPYMLLQDQPYIRRALRNATYTLLGAPLLVLGNAALTLALLAASVVLIVPFALIAPVTAAFLATYSLIAWLERRGLLPESAR